MKMLSKGFGAMTSWGFEFREHCIYGRANRVKFSHTVYRTKKTLDCMHSKLWGPVPVVSRGGNMYFLTIINNCS